MTGADLALYQYVATAITATTTVDAQEIAAIGMVVPDVLISSRLAPTTPGRTLDVASTGEAGIDLTNKLDTAGILPAVAAGGALGLPLLPATGNLKVDVDTMKTKAVAVDSGGTTFPAVVGSSTYAGADTAGVTEILTRIPDADPGSVGGLPTVDAANMVAGVLALGAQAKLDVNAEVDEALTDYGPAVPGDAMTIARRV